MSNSKKQKVGLDGTSFEVDDYEWEAGEKGVTIAMANIRRGVAVSVHRLRAREALALLRQGRHVSHRRRNERVRVGHLQQRVRRAGLLEQIEKCDYDAWKRGEQFKEENEVSEEDTEIDLLDDNSGTRSPST